MRVDRALVTAYLEKCAQTSLAQERWIQPQGAISVFRSQRDYFQTGD